MIKYTLFIGLVSLFTITHSQEMSPRATRVEKIQKARALYILKLAGAKTDNPHDLLEITIKMQEHCTALGREDKALSQIRKKREFSVATNRVNKRLFAINANRTCRSAIKNYTI